MRARRRRAVRRDVHDRARRRGSSRRRWRTATTRTREEYVRAVAAALRDRVPGHRRPRPAAADRRARPRDGAPHAVRRPPARRLPRLGRARRRRHQRRARGHRPGRVRLHVCWGNYEGPHTHDVAARRRSCRCSTRPASARSCCRWPTPATPTSTAASSARPLPDAHGPRRRRDRHDQQLRRAPRGRRRPPRAGSPAPSATRAGSSPAPTAGSTPRPASATSPRRVVWEKLARRCAPAPTWPANGCCPCDL